MHKNIQNFRNIREGNMVRECVTGQQLQVTKDLLDSIKSGRILFEGIPIYDQESNLPHRYNIKTNNMYDKAIKYSKLPIEEDGLTAKHIRIHIEVTEMNNSLGYLYKSWLYHKGRRINVKYFHELQNFIADNILCKV
jgi:hypothetical protein